MNTKHFPASPAAIAAADWEQLAAYYDVLRLAELSSGSLQEWVAAWSALDAIVDEAYSLALIAYTADTRDAEAEAAYLRWASAIAPKLHEVRVELGTRLLPFADELPALSIMMRQLRTDVAIFRAENLPRMAELQEMEAAYDKVTGGLTVFFDGEERTVPALQPYLLVQDRAVREGAFRAGAGAYLAHHEELAALFDRMVRVRHALAREAGFDNYRDYAFEAKYRFDYTPADCVRFHQAVESAVLPAIRRMADARRDALAVDALRPWDLQVRPGRTERLVPFTGAAELIDGSRRVFAALDPELGEFFATMARERLLDLESRQGKAPGGYCTKLPHRGQPFIFMNAVGVHDDVNTLVHEAGHAFHGFLTEHIPYVWQRDTGHEAAELASMSMELLAAPLLAAPVGFYSERDAAEAQLEHLEDILLGLPHIACVDAFQHWIYTDGLQATPADRDARWLELRARYEPAVDYRDIEPLRVARWYRQSHIHTAPFYYIEYGIAQLGALQLWQRSLHDPAGALAGYKAALALGGTVSLPEMYERAGAQLLFDTEPMQRLVADVEARMAELRGVAGGAPGN